MDDQEYNEIMCDCNHDCKSCKYGSWLGWDEWVCNPHFFNLDLVNFVDYDYDDDDDDDDWS
jgi:hypothetical protein